MFIEDPWTTWLAWWTDLSCFIIYLVELYFVLSILSRTIGFSQNATNFLRSSNTLWSEVEQKVEEDWTRLLSFCSWEILSPRDLQRRSVGNKDGLSPSSSYLLESIWTRQTGPELPLNTTANIYMKTTLCSMCEQALWTLEQQRLFSSS